MKTYYLHVKTNKFDNDTVNIQYTLMRCVKIFGMLYEIRMRAYGA